MSGKVTPVLRTYDVQFACKWHRTLTIEHAGCRVDRTRPHGDDDRGHREPGRRRWRDGSWRRRAPRYTRRLSDKILIAFHHACDQSDFEVAEQLLHILEMMLTRRPLTPDGTRRRNMESLVAAHERLWHLRHPHTEDELR